MSGDIFGCHSWESDGLLSPSGPRPGMRAGTEQLSSDNDPAPNVTSVMGEKPWLT